MEHLDLETIKKNPKIFVGYSDVTSLHLILNQKCGLVTFHGPMVSSNMIAHFDAETKYSLFNALAAHGRFLLQNPDGFEIKTLFPGAAEGVLVGGNLALLSASIGTPYELDSRGKILFIEEAEETLGRIERYAYHLRNAGKYQYAAGIILGQFSNCTNEKMTEYTAVECFREILAEYNIPVIFNLQSGHGKPMMTLPFGARCSIDTVSEKNYLNIE